MVDFLINAIEGVLWFIVACVICYTIPFCITRGINDAKKGR